MKTHQFLFAILLGFLTISLNAQGVDVEMSIELKEPATSLVYDLIGGDNNGYYIARIKQSTGMNLLLGSAVSQSLTGDIIIEKYDDQLKFKESKILEHQIGGEKLEYYTAFFFNGRLYALADAYYKSQEKKVLYFQEIVTKDMSTPGKPTAMMTLNNIDKSRYGNFAVQLSPDGSLAALIGLPNAGTTTLLDRNKQKEQATIIASVYDTNMKEVWKKTFELDATEKTYSIVSTEIDNQGNFYWLGINEEGKIDGERKYSYFINMYASESTKPIEISLTLEDKLINDCSFSISPTGEIVVSGFYAEKNIQDIKGVFYSRIDPNSNAALKTSFKAFDTEFMAEFMSERKANKGKELDNFEFSELIAREDGGAVLLAEKYYLTSSTTTDAQGNTRTTYTYHFNEIIVTNINPKGDIDWSIRVPKKQSSSSATAYLSYASMVSDENIYLVFNDNPKNLTETKEDKVNPYNGKNSVAMLVTIDNNGNWSKSELFSNKEEGVVLRPIICNQINKHETLFYAEKGRNYKLGLFKL